MQKTTGQGRLRLGTFGLNGKADDARGVKALVPKPCGVMRLGVEYTNEYLNSPATEHIAFGISVKGSRAGRLGPVGGLDQGGSSSLELKGGRACRLQTGGPSENFEKCTAAVPDSGPSCLGLFRPGLR